MNDNDELARQVEKQVKRIQRSEKERPTLLAQTAYLGSLGLVFVIPVVGGAYLGNWLDEALAGYSMRWTLSLMFLGIVIGGINVYLMIRDHE